MSKPLSVLVIEEREEECQPIIAQLNRGLFEPDYRQVATRPDLLDALQQKNWDIVISDCSLVDFNCLEALKICREYDTGLPFIILAEQVNDKEYQKFLQEGARDVIEKNNLSRLPAVITREIKNIELHDQLVEKIKILIETGKRSHSSVNSLEDVVFTLDHEKRYTSISGRGLVKLGLNAENFVGKTDGEIFAPSIAETLTHAHERALNHENLLLDWFLEKQDGNHLIQTSLSPLLDENGKVTGIVGTHRDISDFRQIETKRKELEAIIRQSPIVIFLRQACDQWPVEYVSENVEQQFGYPAQDFYQAPIHYSEIIHPDDLHRVQNEVKQAETAGETVLTLEYRLITKSGGAKFVEDRILIRQDKAGRVTHYQGLLVDISERKKAERELKESEEKYRRLFEDAILGIFQTTCDGEFITVNNAYARMFGFDSPQEIIDHINAADIFVVPEYRQDILDEIHNSDGTITIQNQYRRKDGSSFIGNLYAWAVEDTNGNLLYIEGFIEDITNRIAAETALRRNEAKYRSLIENLKEGILLADENGIIIEWNHALEVITGIPKEEALQQHVEDIQNSIKFSPQKQYEETQADYAWQIVQNGTATLQPQYFENTFIRRDGVERIMETLTFPIKSETDNMTGSIIRDITERKLTEEVLRLREQEFRALADNAPDGIQRLDREFQYIYVNPATQQILQQPAEQIIGCSLYDIDMPDETREIWVEALNLVFKNQEEMIFEAVHPVNGIEKHYQTRVAPETTLKGTTHTVLCMSRDVTDLKITEDALKRSEEQYRTMVENIQEVIFNLDWNNHITYISPAVTYILGYKPEEMLNQPFVRFVHPNDVSGLGIYFSKSMVTKIEPFEFRMNDKNGTPHNMSISTGPRLMHNQILGLSGVISDMTERTRMKQALADSQKMVDIGTLTAGVAHEIKSPLQAITSISESVIQRFKDNDLEDIESVIRQLEIIHRSGWRISKIASSLLNYARAAEGDIEENDLNEIITDTLLLIEHQLASWSNIFVRTDLSDRLPGFECDRNKITQVLINLLTNARDAMPEGGEICIQTRYSSKTNQLTLRVSDTGNGIPEEIQAFIFEPFFTTKPHGTGTGLGLHIISEIIHKHGGSIVIENTSDLGTTFRVNFPTKIVQKNIQSPIYSLQ